MENCGRLLHFQPVILPGGVDLKRTEIRLLEQLQRKSWKHIQSHPDKTQNSFVLTLDVLQFLECHT